MPEKKFDASSLADYIEVPERIQKFKEQYPDGTLQTVNMEFREFVGKSWVICTAAAFRQPGDETPGIGTAWEQVPGTTPYTKDSEVMNAETSAWGRAIVAVGILGSRKIASAQEVALRQAEREEEETKKAAIRAIAARTRNVEPDERKRMVEEFLGKPVDQATSLELNDFLRTLPVPETAQARVDRALGQQARSLPDGNTPPEL